MSRFVLVTGATGFIGAHIVDVLLSRGIRVRGATRSRQKADLMIKARPQFSHLLEFVQIGDFETRSPEGLVAAVEGVDGIIHTASPFTYDTTNNERELIIPAINGAIAILEAARTNPQIRRIVVTSSFASVLDINRKGPYFTYTGADWNPLTYEESIDPTTSAVVAYRGSKKYAELEAWKYIQEHSPDFDIVALCPPMTFGPVVHPVDHVSKLNESNAMLWKIASGVNPLPVSRVPFWIDVRDLATAHVEALISINAGGKRYIPASPENFSYGIAARIISDALPDLKDRVAQEDQVIDKGCGVDGETASKDLGFTYRAFEETVRDLINQAILLSKS
ncbi:unnamed protein product [Penicillium pancosmium]